MRRCRGRGRGIGSEACLTYGKKTDKREVENLDFAYRKPRIEKIEQLRTSKVICYVTSLRNGVAGQIADDAVREFIDHVRSFSDPTQRIDMLLVSNGGDGVVPWRLMPLLREYAPWISVLVPYKAYSAATIMALGANEIVMHRYGVLGPIDPTVTNEFNPVEAASNRKLGISVEDVKAYIAFIKDTVGIKHEEELVRAIEILANKVHPLALGNVERFLSQSRLIARKLLTLHTDKTETHAIEGIIEALASKLFFHGHPINRVEAKEIGLKVAENVSTELEELMWEVYCSYEQQLNFSETFDFAGRLISQATGKGTPGIFTDLATFDEDITWAVVESMALSSTLDSRVRYTLTADPVLNQSMSAVQLMNKWNQK